MDHRARDGSDLPWELLDRYFSGTSSPGEAARVTEWARGDAARLAELEVLRTVWTHGETVTAASSTWNAKDAIATLERRMRAERISHRQVSRSSRRSWVPMVGLAVGAIVVVLLAGVFVRGHGATTREFVALPGQLTAVTLPDGTRMVLAPGSDAKLRGTREVELRGEGFFAVTHDARHPFQVFAHGVLVRDVGTAFGVRAFADDSAVQVAVTEGEVAVGHAQLKAGDMATVHGVVTDVLRGADVTSATAWTTGRLEFAETPVREVLTEVGRWYDLDIRTNDPSLLAHHVTATFTNVSPNEVLASLAATLDAQVQRQGQHVTLVARHVSTDRAPQPHGR